MTQLGGTGVAVAVDHLDPDAGAAPGRRGSATTTATSTCSSTTSGAPRCSRAGRPSGTRRSGSTTSTTACASCASPIDTHLITSHHLLPLLDRPARRAGRRGHRRHRRRTTPSHYRISVFYDLAKVAVNRLAFSQGHELAPHGATAVAITPGLAALGDDARRLRRRRGELARRRRPAATTAARRAPGLRARPSRRATSAGRSPRSPPTPTGPRWNQQSVDSRPARRASTGSPTSTARSPTPGAGSEPSRPQLTWVWAEQGRLRSADRAEPTRAGCHAWMAVVLLSACEADRRRRKGSKCRLPPSRRRQP